MSYVGLFSGHAEQYAAARPGYPTALFDWIAAGVERHELAWDCATGNGQAARGLADRFARVIATDASGAQLAHAVPHPRIEYRQAHAEASGLDAASADVVTVAQALHWFDLRAFFAEVDRVLVAGGLLVVWSYAVPTISPAIDAAVQRIHDDVVGPYWTEPRLLVEEGYRSITLPFPAVEAPAFEMSEEWTLERFTAYVRTWSAVQRYIADHHRDPVDALRYELGPLWGAAHERRVVRWPLSVKAGRC